MLRGTHSINLDAKGRIAVPTRYREELSELCDRQMVITAAVNAKCAGVRGCLWLYPLPEWEDVELKINKMPNFNPTAEKLKRFFLGNATDCDIDAQGRLLIPERLRSLAKLDKRLMIAGIGNKFEIWNEPEYGGHEDDWMEGGNSDGLDELKDVSF